MPRLRNNPIDLGDAGDENLGDEMTLTSTNNKAK